MERAVTPYEKRKLSLFHLAGLLLLLLLPSACSTTPPYVYHYVPGRTALLTAQGFAVAPPEAPPEVHAAIAAGNRISGKPYQRGGGHAHMIDDAYDCSGAVSYLLNAAGCMRGSMPSTSFREFDERGEGEWISIYAKRGHVFAVVAGLRFDTGYGNGQRGPQWTTRSRPADGYVIRHPEDL